MIVWNNQAVCKGLNILRLIYIVPNKAIIQNNRDVFTNTADFGNN